MKYLTELNSNEIKAVAYGMAIAHSLQTSELFDYTIFDVQINESQFYYEFIIKYGALERDFTLLKQETIIKLSRSIYNSILSLENDIIEEENEYFNQAGNE